MFALLRCNLRRLRARVAVLLLAFALAVVPLASGCYGKFPVTRAVYSINGQVGPFDSLHAVVMWVFIPVYGVSFIVDAFVFNLIEFWTGVRVPTISDANDAETPRLLALLLDEAPRREADQRSTP